MGCCSSKKRKEKPPYSECIVAPVPTYGVPEPADQSTRLRVPTDSKMPSARSIRHARMASNGCTAVTSEAGLCPSSSKEDILRAHRSCHSPIPGVPEGLLSNSRIELVQGVTNVKVMERSMISKTMTNVHHAAGRPILIDNHQRQHSLDEDTLRETYLRSIPNYIFAGLDEESGCVVVKRMYG